MMNFLQSRFAKLTQRRLAGTRVFACRPIVSRGEYVPRGVTGSIRRVLASGDYEVAFDGEQKIVIPVDPAYLTRAPALAHTGAAASKVRIGA